VIGTLGSVIIVALAAYPISKKRLIFRKFFTFSIMLTLWFQAGMIPTFLVVKNLGLIDSHAALILVPLLSAYHVIIMRTFFENVPAELEESATIDGANDIQILTRIYMPLSKPVIATISLWVAVGLWNAFLEPLLYLNDSRKYTLQLVLREIVIANTGFNLGIDTGTDHGDEFEVVAESVKYATVIIATVPILMIYPFVQKYFVKGVMIGAVKG
jgi:ABC-type glycerol-3-phosphate transport system permease component